ncbi:MAG: Flp family type IVb pilin [Candidatus Firestonebacteria bacterium]
MKNQKGQTTTEYILIIALIVAVAIAGFRVFGPAISTLFKTTSAKVVTEANAPIP